MKKIEVYSSGDYAGMNIDNTHFYYGYEVTTEDENGDDEWCFQVKVGAKEVYRKTTSQIMEAIPDFDHDDPIYLLLAGIGLWMSEDSLNKTKKS